MLWREAGFVRKRMGQQQQVAAVGVYLATVAATTGNKKAVKLFNEFTESFTDDATG